MTKERAGFALPEIPDFKTGNKQHPVDKELIRKSAEAAGFTARHAVVDEKFDPRSLRKTERKERINVAMSAETKARFWAMVIELEMKGAADLLVHLMDHYDETRNSN